MAFILPYPLGVRTSKLNYVNTSAVNAIYQGLSILHGFYWKSRSNKQRHKELDETIDYLVLQEGFRQILNHDMTCLRSTYRFSHGCIQNKGGCDCEPFSMEGTISSSQTWHVYRTLPAIELIVTFDLKGLAFFHDEWNWICYNVTRFLVFWITLTAKLISLEHCSSRNRKILRHIAHTLNFLAWLSRIIRDKSLN